MPEVPENNVVHDKDKNKDGALETTCPHGDAGENYEGDEFDYKGWEKVPAALLKVMIVNPLVGDIIKAEVLQWELNHEKGKDDSPFIGLAGLVGHAASKAQTEEETFFLSGQLDENSVAALGEMIKEPEDAPRDIHFPWMTYGWKTLEEAQNALHYM